MAPCAGPGYLEEMPPTTRSRSHRPTRLDSSGDRWSRRLPVGAEVLPDGGVEFRVWAPGKDRVEVVLDPDGAASIVPMAPDGGGYYKGKADAGPGTRYGYRLDGRGRAFPDPA